MSTWAFCDHIIGPASWMWLWVGNWLSVGYFCSRRGLLTSSTGFCLAFEFWKCRCKRYVLWIADICTLILIFLCSRLSGGEGANVCGFRRARLISDLVACRG